MYAKTVADARPLVRGRSVEDVCYAAGSMTASRRNIPSDPVHASWLRVVRCARGYTASQLAWKVGVTPGMISAIELEDKSPSDSLADRIAEVLGVSRPLLFPPGDGLGESPYTFLTRAWTEQADYDGE